ncbi:uncharacterized protein K02A2.6-like [Solanum tuberosum]|uniref:uncharacterized protein K02A2.6-like n=1 Tax=Solanum tuberosum TaxID=4113 RepID=UPI00073A2CD5|nr:PREDICTED: uncharacterized protein K02A2.6-like [Solanum tuberosum]
MAFRGMGNGVIGPIEPKASNGHRFILVAIDYFTKWVIAVTFKSVTKKVMVDFIHFNIIYRFGIPTVIVTDNAANLNSRLMQEVCHQFKIEHRNSTPYRPKANGDVEVANKNIKKILCKMVQVIPAEVEIPSLWIVVEAEIDDDEWIRTRLDQLTLIDEKRLTSVSHGQLYQKRMTRAYNKKVRLRCFEEGQLVLRHILPHQAEVKGKFSPNWKGPFIVKKVLSNGAL